MAHAKTSYVCLSCRASYKQPYDKKRREEILMIPQAADS
jgi:DNA-directed RNA polymerase subunit RPC12/RpoP